MVVPAAMQTAAALTLRRIRARVVVGPVVTTAPRKRAAMAGRVTSCFCMSLRSRVFTSSGTFVVPTGVSWLWVSQMAGGGGGSSQTGNQDGKGGGGSGEFCHMLPVPVVAGDSYSITVGAAGTGATGSPEVGANNGGTSTISGFSVLGGFKSAQGSGQTFGGAGGGPNGGGGGTGGGTAGSAGAAESPTCFGGTGGGAGGSNPGAVGGQVIGQYTSVAGIVPSGGTDPGGSGGASWLGDGGTGGDGNVSEDPANEGGVGGTGAGGGGAGADGGSGPSPAGGGAGGIGRVVVFWMGPA